MSDPAFSNQLVSSLMQSDAKPIAGSTTVAQARAAASGQVLVLLDAANRPLGVLPEEQLAHLDAERALQDYPDLIFPVAVTTAETPVQELLPGMRGRPDVRWHLVMSGPEIQGVISPAAFTAAGFELWGNPGAGVGQTFTVCYLCDQGTAPHRVAPKDVRQKDWFGQAICPIHNVAMMAENPCQGQTQ
jgi:hypothetical protein